MRRKLTPAFCKTATAEEGQDRTYYWDESKPGFYLMVTTSGHRSFGIQYRMSRRKSPRMRIKATSLDAARKEATKLLGEVANGGDPLGERRKRATEAEGTFKRVRSLSVSMVRSAQGATSRRRSASTSGSAPSNCGGGSISDAGFSA